MHGKKLIVMACLAVVLALNRCAGPAAAPASSTQVQVQPALTDIPAPTQAPRKELEKPATTIPTFEPSPTAGSGLHLPDKNEAMLTIRNDQAPSWGTRACKSR